jgi:hypothetical protein
VKGCTHALLTNPLGAVDQHALLSVRGGGEEGVFDDVGINTLVLL